MYHVKIHIHLEHPERSETPDTEMIKKFQAVEALREAGATSSPASCPFHACIYVYFLNPFVTLDEIAEIRLKYRARNKGLQILLSNSQERPGRKVKQKQEEISRNHVQAFFPGSVHSQPTSPHSACAQSDS